MKRGRIIFCLANLRMCFVFHYQPRHHLQHSLMFARLVEWHQDTKQRNSFYYLVIWKDQQSPNFPFRHVIYLRLRKSSLPNHGSILYPNKWKKQVYCLEFLKEFA